MELHPVAQLQPVHRPPDEQSLELGVDMKDIVEAALFVASKPLSVAELQALFPENAQPEAAEIGAVLAALAEEFNCRPLELKQVASGYRFQVRERLSPWISRLFEERPARYSKAFLETLAIIAYRQPVTRGEIEQIRGVAVSTQIIRNLLEREWVQVVGHKEIPGRPGLYATTRPFLDYFNLKGLDELPPLQSFLDRLGPIADIDLPVPETTARTHDQTEPTVQAENDPNPTPSPATGPVRESA